MPTFPIYVPDPETGERPDEPTNLPAHYEICSRCRGEGKSSAYLGAFTREDFDEDPDFAESYFSGDYDKPCKSCKGTGKVVEIDREQCTTEAQKAALKYLDDKAEWRRESFEEHKRESLMLGESTLRDWDGIEP